MKPVRATSVDWVPIAQDLFLERASPARIAAWLDGTVTTQADYVVVRGMAAIDGFDATILVRDGHAVSLSVWYRDIEKPTLAHAESVLGAAREYPARLFDLVFDGATRPVPDGTGKIVVSCSADRAPFGSDRRLLVGIAITHAP